MAVKKGKTAPAKAKETNAESSEAPAKATSTPEVKTVSVKITRPIPAVMVNAKDLTGPRVEKGARDVDPATAQRLIKGGYAQEVKTEKK